MVDYSRMTPPSEAARRNQLKATRKAARRSLRVTAEELPAVVLQVQRGLAELVSGVEMIVTRVERVQRDLSRLEDCDS